MNDILPVHIKGKCILAVPGLPDPNFSQAVTCMCEHNETGSLGLIVNRIHPLLTSRELFDDLAIPYHEAVDKIPVHLGGPVQPNGVFVLHGPPFQWEGTLVVNNWLGLSNSRDILGAVAAGKGPENFMILLGCAGWGPMQLDMELHDNAWLISKITPEIIFSTPVDRKYEHAMMEIY